MHDELALYVESGLTPLEALRTATLNPAQYLGAIDSLWTVEPGKLADLVLLDANPLEDISNTQKIHAVVANWRYFDRQALNQLLSEAEKAADPQEGFNQKTKNKGPSMRSFIIYTSSLYFLILLFMSTLTPIHAQVGPPPADPGSVQMVDVDGHAVRVHVLGLEQREVGQPVVVFEAGAGNPLEVWGLVLPHIAESTPVVTYDRAGLGQSEWDDEVPTPQHVAQRLHSVLDQIGAGPPYLLVGYSWGGTLARYFAGLHPEEVAGVVYVDPGPIVTQPLAENLVPFEEIGAGREGYEAFWSQVSSFYEQAPPPMRAEFEVFRGLMEQEVPNRKLLPVPEVPVVVILTGKYQPPPPFLQLPYDPLAHFEAGLRHKLNMLSEWALESPTGTFVVSKASSHGLLGEEPGLVVWAIQRVLAAAKEEP